MEEAKIIYRAVSQDPEAEIKANHAPELYNALVNCGFKRVGLLEARAPEMPGFADRPKSGEDIAGDVMNAQIYAVPTEAKLQEIAKMMTEHQIHRVLVERDGKHVGLISTMEIMSALCA